MFEESSITVSIIFFSSSSSSATGSASDSSNTPLRLSTPIRVSKRASSTSPRILRNAVVEKYLLTRMRRGASASIRGTRTKRLTVLNRGMLPSQATPETSTLWKVTFVTVLNRVSTVRDTSGALPRHRSLPPSGVNLYVFCTRSHFSLLRSAMPSPLCVMSLLTLSCARWPLRYSSRRGRNTGVARRNTQSRVGMGRCASAFEMA
mmetsp:Transcript_25883/g.65854  ORF Transcript_25883/g.65854 Transcript_25883/m.65854 type:complete len:205 (+) Transcript_25883:121-735(+)